MVKALACGADGSGFESHYALEVGPHPLLTHGSLDVESIKRPGHVLSCLCDWYT